MIDKFLEDYDTIENYQRVFGGQIEFKEPKIDTQGHLSISFSRPVLFPTVLMAEYDDSYKRQIPELKPTEKELEEIRENYAKFVVDVESRSDLVEGAQEEREVCNEVEKVESITTSSESSSKSLDGGDW